LIDTLRERYKQHDLLQAFSMKRSSYQYHRQNVAKPNMERVKDTIPVMKKQ